jgi:DNA helicase HerA-like ATPase
LLTVREPLGRLVDALPALDAPGLASEDAPIPFKVEELPPYLELLAKTEDFSQGAQHVPMLLTRIRTMLADPRLRPIVNPPKQPSLDEWLARYVGEPDAANGEIVVIDLSLVPSDVLHVAIAVIARVVFEACQRYRKLSGTELPTALVLEEAHTFIRRTQAEGAEEAGTRICRETFERIAREGRKFGLGLVLSSQRPSELSPTVLAQCNTFLLHRIVNDRDQELVARLVPDNLGGLLRELPSLPSARAVLLGWATPVPILVSITELSPSQRPTSNDPRFWDVWTGTEERALDWAAIAKDWQQT